MKKANEVEVIEERFDFRKHNKILFFVEIVLTIIMTIFNVGIAFVLQGFLQIGVSGNFGQLQEFVSMSIIYMLIYGVIAILEGRIKNKYVRNSMTKYNKYVTSKILNKDIREFRKHSIGEYLSIFNNDLKIIEEDCVKGLINITLNIFLFLFGLIAMILVDFRVTIVIIVSSLLPVAVSLFFSKGTSETQKEVSQNNGNYTSSIKDSLAGLIVIKTFNAVSKVYDVLKNKNIFLEKVKEKYNNRINTIQVLSLLSGYCVILITFGFSVWLVLKGELEVACIITFIQLLNYLLNPIQQISVLSSKYIASKAIMKNIDDTIMNSTFVKNETVQVESFNKSIMLKNVSFSYDDEKKTLLDINLEFEKGKAYAIVGPSGSGKSTLINIIMNYYSNYSGTVAIDDADIKSIDADSLCNLMALIQQDVYIFDDTLLHNIKMFGEYEKKDVDRIVEITKIDEIIDERGADYHCAENGSDLSGGEKQRISIARALIKDTPILLLDEATSALDNETAQSIENTILSLKETTRIVVMHKMSENILKKYDKIIMMKNGRVVESGTFDELMERKKDFYSLYSILQ